jgi:hypothetical protein
MNRKEEDVVLAACEKRSAHTGKERSEHKFTQED